MLRGLRVLLLSERGLSKTLNEGLEVIPSFCLFDEDSDKCQGQLFHIKLCTFWPPHRAFSGTAPPLWNIFMIAKVDTHLLK